MRSVLSKVYNVGFLALVLVGACSLWLAPLEVFAQEEQPGTGKDVNRVVSVTVNGDPSAPQVNITTEKPVGYRYTVYDSFDPLRVVIDFPRMDVSEVKSPLPVNVGPIKEIRVVSFDLTLGKLGRIEILVDRKADYTVNLDGNNFSLVFKPAGSAAPAPVAAVEPAATAPVTAPTPAAERSPSAAPAPVAAPSARPEKLLDAQTVTAVEIEEGKAAILTDGPIEKYRYFNLGAPPRLVLDIFGVKPAFRERTMAGARGFDRVRVGTYDDKTRFVFDAGGAELPPYEVDPVEQGIVVTWKPGAARTATTEPAKAPEVKTVEVAPRPQPAPTPAPREVPRPAPQVPEAVSAPAPKPAAPVPAAAPAPTPSPSVSRMTQAPTAVEDVAFKIEGGKSILTVDLSGAADISQPVERGNVVLFGVNNATISRALRRVIDTSAFPSALEMVTPYTVNRGTVQDVRFAARLKGDVSYRLRQVGDTLVFEVDNGAFAQAPAPETLVVAAPAPTPTVRPSEPAAAVPAPLPFTARSLLSEDASAVASQYSGQRISLVFDNADVRNLLQLIAEVSNLNIIASDEVRGDVSIRLIDVPWDQALDVILDIKQLGMIQEGNVVRILPKSKIREMEEAELTAAKNKRELEPLVTEVFSISYTDLGNISAPVRELMTDRGRLTQDERNKKLIVKDIPSVMNEIGNLIEILDTPERQVMIEARIVEASSDFTRDLGVNWGISYQSPGSTLDSFDIGLGGNFLVGLPAPGSATTNAGLGTGITFGQLNVDKTVIDLRISALESSGKGKIISRPRVTTLNGQEAVITQGTTIPYQTSGADGPKTEFVDATLELKVVPVINPDNSIIMDIVASNSAPGQSFTDADLPGINKKEAKTKVLVFDGDTTVIGGIFVEDDSETESGVPWLMKVPVLGHLVKSTSVTTRRSELLIFVTPRILE